MELYTVIGLAIVAAVMAVVLRQYKPEYAMLLGLGASILILLGIISAVSEIIAQIEDMLAITNMPQGYVEILFKALGISIITQLASDSCKDAGETAIASRVELAGKISILLISLPLFERLLEIVRKLLSI